MKFIDLTGKTFGRLFIIGKDHIREYPCGQKKHYWKADCLCGKSVVVSGDQLRIGDTTSCGCYHKEATSLAKTTHGLSHHHLYEIWSNMMQRCENPKHPAWRYYGGRGITVCEEWRTPGRFIDDMLPAFVNGLEIERVDNNSGYSKQNCTWATRSQQLRNTRRSKR